MAIVVVIDDDEQVRRAVERFLVRRGHDVITAKDGHDAMHRTSHCVPDLFITDHDGLNIQTFCRLFRQYHFAKICSFDWFQREWLHFLFCR